jgi:HEXXH motif-containing protein
LAGWRVKLDARRWVSSGTIDAQWSAVRRRRIEVAKGKLRRALNGLPEHAAARARRRRYDVAAQFLLQSTSESAARVLTHPCFDYWISLSESHFLKPVPDADFDLYWGQLAGFALGATVSDGNRREFSGTLDPDGRLYLYGTPWFLEFPRHGRAAVRLAARGAKISAAGAGFNAEVDLLPRDAGGVLHALEQVVPGIVCDDRGWLQLHGVVMHGRIQLDAAEGTRFAATLRQALADLEERDPLMSAEIRQLVHVIVPLANPNNFGSVSSTYANLRGMIALSHSDDILLQAETLIHEGSHLKMNQLLEIDPVLEPGQGAQVYYSPWRPDARRLRGLLLGAHAFLNVGRYLARSLQREEYHAQRRSEIMSNVARRIYQIEDALRALTENASLTEFGRRVVLEMCRELGILRHAALSFPPTLLAEQQEACAAHRRAHCLSGTVFHRTTPP